MAKFCAKCGAPLEDGANFCTECGKPVLKEPVEAADESMTSAGNAAEENAAPAAEEPAVSESAPEQDAPAASESAPEQDEPAASESAPEQDAPAASESAATPGAGLDAEQMRRFVPALAVFMILLVIIIVSAARGYRKPIKQFAKGINRKSGKIMSEAVFDESMNADDWERSIDSQFGKDAGFDAIKVKIKIKDKDKMDLDDFREKYSYMDEGVLDEMKKPCTVDTRSAWKMTYHDKSLKFDVDMDFIVVKYKGDWKIIGADMNDMYEEMVNALNSL